MSSTSIVFAAALLCAALPAAAQSAAQRPFKGAFGGAAPDPGVHDSLESMLSVAEGYDDNVLGTGLTAAGSPLLQSGVYTHLSGSLMYTHLGKAVQFGASEQSSTRYYASEGTFLGASHSGAVSLSAVLGPRFHLQVNQSVSYSPSYLYAVFPSLGTPAGTDVEFGEALSNQHALVSESGAVARFKVSRRGSIEALGSYRLAHFDGGPSSSVGISTDGLRAWSAGGRYRYGLSRHATLRLGYVRREGEYALTSGAPTTIHDIDVGVDYSRPLSLSRRTSLTFGMGSSLVNSPEAAATGQTKLQYHVLGDVTVTHHMGRTWQLRGTYTRGVGFAEGYAAPVASDAVRIATSGFLSRRADLTVDTGTTVGDVGLLGAAERLHAYTASARLRLALARAWAVFAEYDYYKQDLAQVLLVPTDVPGRFDRNALRAGLTLWLPLVRR